MALLFDHRLLIITDKEMKLLFYVRKAWLSTLLTALFAASWSAPAMAQEARPLAQTFPDTFNLEFPEGDTLRKITEPVFLGEASFMRRLGARMTSGASLDATRESLPKTESETYLPKSPPSQAHASLGLVLCGGSARAYAHIGVLKALEKAGIYPDFIVASSMGAIVGTLYAAGYSPDDIQRLIHAMPLESYFDIVIPTNGGFINTENFRATLRKLTDNLDLSETEIPIIITAEDLKSRQQIWIAEGSLANAMTGAFAMPAIFEPQSFNLFELIDAGATIIAPVEPATRLSDRLIVSTAFYDRAMNFSSPITVLNRAVDIGKTRAGMEEIEKSHAFVIRNDVEDLSYMQFSDPDIIISKGELSARKALDALDSVSRARLENAPPPDFSEYRKIKHDRLMITIRQLQTGALSPTTFTMRGLPILRLLKPVSSSPGEPKSDARVGASLAFSISKLRASVSYFTAVNPDPEKEWAVETGIRANPMGSLNVWLTSRLWGNYDNAYILGHTPTYWELSGLMENMAVLKTKKIGFQLGGDMFLRMDNSVATWQTLGLAEMLSTQKFSPAGPLLQPWFAVNVGGFVENTSGEDIATGIQGTLTGSIRSTWLSPKARAFAKFSLNGQKFLESKFDGFRSSASRGAALFNLITNTEIALVLRNIYLDMAESLLFRNFEIAPFFDTRWNDMPDGTFRMRDWAAGLSFSFEARAFGLAPAPISLYASYSGSKIFTIQLRTGILLPDQ